MCRVQQRMRKRGVFFVSAMDSSALDDPIMSSTNQLVFAVLQFLEDQQAKLSSEAAESLQVASECLENVFGVSHRDTQYRLPTSLTQLFDDAVTAQVASQPPISAETKEAAEQHKTQGNVCMKEERYKEALECYGRAIALDAQNAVYYSNRAAAHSKLNDHQKAIDDCQRALNIDSEYSKAYGRKGLAHTALNEHENARDCYKRALELDASNDSYKNNLEMAEKQLREVATSMMGNPQMQQMMAGMMPGAAGGGGAPEGVPQGMEGLLQAGQQLAQQMQASNPDLVEQLRSQMNPPNNPDNSSGDSI